MGRGRRRTFFRWLRLGRVFSRIFDLILLGLLAGAAVLFVVYKDEILGTPKDSLPFYIGKN